MKHNRLGQAEFAKLVLWLNQESEFARTTKRSIVANVAAEKLGFPITVNNIETAANVCNVKLYNAENGGLSLLWDHMNNLESRVAQLEQKENNNV